MSALHVGPELVQAVSDWQRGGDAAQKQRRALALKSAAASLPEEYRHTSLCCFRQIALGKGHIWQLHDTLTLAETISSWTLDLDVAKGFKGGVPPAGGNVIAVILEVVPPRGSVVLNLHALYRAEEFSEACEQYKPQVRGYAAGIGTYGDSQSEVVIELAQLPISSVYAYGGHSSTRNEFGRRFFGPQPTAEEMDYLDRLIDLSPRKPGPRWLTGAAKDRVMAKGMSEVERLASRWAAERGLAPN